MSKLQQNLVQVHVLRRIYLLVALLLTSLTFAGVTKLGWTNWDDNFYVYENELVANADFQGIFGSTVIGNYNPLPIATFALEWQLVGDQSWLYHFDNLWMHLVCTALVFWLMGMLGIRPLWAGFAALMFGIHPMHVESVAWVTERKDVLYGMFYLGSLVAYLHFRKYRSKAWYALCLVLFVLALFSKIQAVTLPLTMLLLDAYLDRTWPTKDWLTKVPFFLGALVFGLVGIAAIDDMQGFNSQSQVDAWERFVLGLNSFFVYLVKAVFPYETCVIYPWPKNLSFQHMLGSVMAIAMVVCAIFLRKRIPILSFGLAFFGIHIVFLLQFVSAGHAFQADRFSYIAYIGLFFVIAAGAQAFAGNHRNRSLIAGVLLVMLNLGLAIRSVQYIPKWKNSFTIWDDMILKYPHRFHLAYINRGEYLKSAEIDDLGLADFNTAIELVPNYYLGYLHRADICFVRGHDEQAILDYTMVLQLVGPYGGNELLNDALTHAFGNRGSLHVRQGRPSEGLADLNLALQYKPDNLELHFSRGLAYNDLGNLPKAIEDFSAILTADPNSVAALVNRGVVFINSGQFQNAKQDFDRALQLDPGNQAAKANKNLLEGQ
jgi:tetratricopeptide (TPR) repeat protein